MANPNPVEDLRERAIESFFEDLKANGHTLGSPEAEAYIHETAAYFVPAHYDSFKELAFSPYRQCAANFLLLYPVDAQTIGQHEISGADALNRAVYEFLCEEIGKELSDRIDQAVEELEQQVEDLNEAVLVTLPDGTTVLHKAFLHFTARTDVEDVWEWIDQQYSGLGKEFLKP